MTRRMTTLKWVFYALWTLVFLLVQQLVFPYLRIAGVHPFILPSLAAIAASFEGKREGPVYALVLGLVCDTLFTGAFPCFYAVVLTLSALLAGQAAHYAGRGMLAGGIRRSAAADRPVQRRGLYLLPRHAAGRGNVADGPGDPAVAALCHAGASGVFTCSPPVRPPVIPPIP